KEEPKKPQPPKKLSESFIGRYGIGVLASVLIFAGLISFIYTFWDKIPDLAKYVGILVLGLGVTYAGMALRKRFMAAEPFFSILIGIGLGVTFIDITAGGRVWLPQTDLTQLVILGLMVLWQLNGFFVNSRVKSSVLYVVLYLGVWAGIALAYEAVSKGGFNPLPMLYTLAAAAIGVGAWLRYKLPVLRHLSILTAVAVAVSVVAVTASRGAMNELAVPYLIFSAVLLLAALVWAGRGEEIALADRRSLVSFAELLLLGLTSAALTYELTQCSLDSETRAYGNLIVTAVFCSAMALLALGALCTGKNRLPALAAMTPGIGVMWLVMLGWVNVEEQVPSPGTVAAILPAVLLIIKAVLVVRDLTMAKELRQKRSFWADAALYALISFCFLGLFNAGDRQLGLAVMAVLFALDYADDLLTKAPRFFNPKGLLDIYGASACLCWFLDCLEVRHPEAWAVTLLAVCITVHRLAFVIKGEWDLPGILARILYYLGHGFVVISPIIAGLGHLFGGRYDPEEVYCLSFCLTLMSASGMYVMFTRLGDSLPLTILGFVHLNYNIWMISYLWIDDEFAIFTTVAALIIAALLIYAGFRFKKPAVRKTALAVVIIYVFKLLTVDIQGGGGVRVIGFLLSGLICLGISLLYNRLDKQYSEKTEKNE
ncbi:MAG: hypothetical protein II794_04790, partial [Oscillospiraceae bacterium]|nr:hypothetical protein [Oscillospiraceae bacterium]